MKFSQLLERLESALEKTPHTLECENHEWLERSIKGVSADSRTLKKGEIFCLFSEEPEQVDAYTAQALEKGAIAIVTTPKTWTFLKKTDHFNKCIYVICENPRQIYAKMLSRLYGPLPANLVAVTGTNGKTSVTHILKHIWDTCGIKSALIGTNGIYINPKKTIPLKVSLTTPDAKDIFETLTKLKAQGIDHVVMEASSHGLDQHRLDGLKFRAAAFTNFSQDHLDYHKTMEAYFDAKTRLFKCLISSDGSAILNTDIPQYEELLEICVQRNKRTLSYGKYSRHLQLLSVEATPDGSKVKVLHEESELSFSVPAYGLFQVCNTLCAITIAHDLGTNIQTSIKAIKSLKPIPGRLEQVGKKGKAPVFVDYAHKPEALRASIKSLKAHYPSHQISLVFGCGGDRDKEKRKIMGEIAQEYADHIIITDDNPRFEDPERIRRAIFEGCPSAKIIPSREVAINTALSSLGQKQVLLVAGKGHENYQLIEDKKIPFSDTEFILNFLKPSKKSDELPANKKLNRNKGRIFRRKKHGS